MVRANMTFPADFRWGTATAAYQVEGNNLGSDWWAWEQQTGTILGGNRSGLACNWWQNAEADLELAAEMGTNAHRLSLEWSRIEPEPSVFDRQALDRYRQILQAMHDRGIEPMVTLHHFSNPVWLTEKKDFNSRIVVDYFQRYVAKAVAHLGDLVPKWVTINEPMVYLFMRYLKNAFPAAARPGWLGGIQAARNMLRCHAAAYHQIKSLYPAAQVGVAKHIAVIAPRPDGSRVDAWWARLLSYLFNDLWLRCMQNGRLFWPLGRERMLQLRNSFDFLGLNYYTRFFVKFPPRGDMIDREWPAGSLVSDGNYGEIFPQGLYIAMKKLFPYKKPVYITENGLPDRADRYRASFLISHLREVWRAINFCYPVMGYYHWSLVDNFEWDRGWSQRFGLIAMDPESQERTLRASGRLYTEICHSNSVSSEMAARYAPELLPQLFRGRSL